MLELHKQGNVGIPLFIFQYKFQFSLCVTNVNSSLQKFKKFNYFFQIKPSLGINNNIILRINISMSKNTGFIDITKFLQPIYTINNPNICSDTLDQLAYSQSIIKLVIQLSCSAIFLLLKKQSGLKSNTPRGFSPLPKA